jgi:tripartite-type tricarboxylate transporter receptor subunit TctC
MKKINKVLKEIREVRRQFYQETKYMTVNERTEYIRQQREKMNDEIAKYGIRQLQPDFSTATSNQKVRNEMPKFDPVAKLRETFPFITNQKIKNKMQN